MKQFLIALQFLTIFPVKIRSKINEKDFGVALLYFPLIGLLIGLILLLSALLFSFLPNLLRGALILIISITITGGIHLDGFADTVDSLYGGRTREEILKVMRDSHIGTMGVISLICLLLLKFTLIVSLPQRVIYKALLVMPVFSRWFQSFTCYKANYARQEGKAKYFIEQAARKQVISGLVFTIILFCLTLQLKAIKVFIGSFLLAFLFFQYIKKKVGGMTGDTIGALNELAEVSSLLFIF